MTQDYKLIIYEITDKCNSVCPVCFQKGKSWRQIGLEEFTETLKHFTGKEVRLLGGEPTLHPNVLEMIEAIHKSGNTAYMSSNGIRIGNDRAFAKELVRCQDSGKLMVNISLNGGLNRYQTIAAHGRDELETKMDALANLNELKLLSVSSIIQRGKEFVIEDLLSLKHQFENIKNITFRADMIADKPYRTNDFIRLMLERKVMTRKDLSKVVVSGMIDKRCNGNHCCFKVIKDGYALHWYDPFPVCFCAGTYDVSTSKFRQYTEG
jgi:molybdenum cofactor biosynthesis enzyme MoaA